MAEPTYYYSHIIENIVGITTGPLSSGVLILDAFSGVKLDNILGENKSPTGATGVEGAYGIMIRTDYDPFQNDPYAAIILVNSQGRSTRGNGIYASNVELKNCIANIPYSGGELSDTYYGFVIAGTTNLDECSSVELNTSNSNSVLLTTDYYSYEGSIIKMNGCNFKSINQISDVSGFQFDLRITNSTLKTPYIAIDSRVGYKNLEINNCSIESGLGLFVGDNTTINNSVISTDLGSYAITGYTSGPTSTGARVSYSNNTIIGSTTTNAGVTGIYQGIPRSTITDSFGNIVHSRISMENLVLYYDADRTNSYPGSGSIITDISPRSLVDSTITGSFYTSSEPGGFEGGSFNSSSSAFATSNYDPSLALFGEITIEVFVRVNSVGGGYSNSPTIVSKNGGVDFYLGFDTFGQPRFSSANGVTNLTSNSTIALDTWTHIVLTFSQSVGIFYINGFTSGSVPVNYVNSNAGVGVVLGRATPFDYLRGQIGMIRIYNRALEYGEVVQNFLSDKSRYGL